MTHRACLLVLLVLGIAASACRSTEPPLPRADDGVTQTDSAKTADPEVEDRGQRSNAACAASVVTALASKDATRLAELAHPQRGVRFTPFAFVNTAKDVRLLPAELASAFSDPTIRDWGLLGESDDRIRMTFAQYHARFIYDADYARMPVARAGAHDAAEAATFNIDLMLKTLRDAYPRGEIAEYHEPPNPVDNSGWSVLRLVCEEHQGAHYLVGVTHSESTP